MIKPSQTHDARTTASAALYVAFVLPILAAVAITLRFAVNVPIIDDYPDVLGFALNLQHLPALGARLLSLVTVQHAEYKFVIMHLAVALEVALTHRVNLTVLSVAGDLSLLGLLWVLWKTYWPAPSSPRKKLLLFLPIACLLFQLNYAEGVAWTSASLDYFTVIFFSFLSLLLLTRAETDRRHVMFACSCAAMVLAFFTAPNALMLVPLGLLVLRRQPVYALAWCASALLGVSPYLFHYVPGPPAPHTSVKMFSLFFASFLGAGNPAFRAAIPAGILMLAVFFYALRKNWYRSHRCAVLQTTWLLGSAAMVSWGRSHSGLEFSTISRYKIFSDLLIIFCYAVAVDRIDRSSWSVQRTQLLLLGASLVSAAICLRADIQGARILKAQRATLLQGLAQYQASPETTSPMYFPDAATETFFGPQEAEALTLTRQAVREGLYTPPTAQ